ncbi:MAG TPA: hypothetical protein VE734_00730 [Terriglobales bacterium]|nr:hypothetical protein [Terriglobales bacterium]
MPNLIAVRSFRAEKYFPILSQPDCGRSTVSSQSARLGTSFKLIGRGMVIAQTKTPPGEHRGGVIAARTRKGGSTFDRAKLAR